MVSGFPSGIRGKEAACLCRRSGFDCWVGMIPWSRKWQPTPVFLPEKFHGQRSLVGYTVHGVAKSWTQLSAHTHTSNGISLKSKSPRLVNLNVFSSRMVCFLFFFFCR